MKTRNTQQVVKRRNTLVLVGVFMIVAAVVAVPVYSVRSSSLGTGSSRATVPPGAPSSASRINSLIGLNYTSLAPGSARFGSLLPVPTPSPETIATYASDCTTPKTAFVLGEEVCALVNFVTEPDRFVNWLSPPDTSVAFSSPTIPDNLTHSYKYTPLVAGTWKATIASSSDSSIIPTVFTVESQSGSLKTFAYVAGSCTTIPKVSFNLGETVCAKITGAGQPSLSSGLPTTRIGWVSPYGSLTQGAYITSDPQTATYVIPNAATEDFTDVGGGVVTVDNRGVWRLSILSALDGSLIESTNFTVHDPLKAYVDLSVSQSTTTGEAEVGSGSGNVFRLFISNRGPDTAHTVVLSDTVPANTTFSSAIENTSLGFDCVPPVGGVFTCTLDNMAAGATAEITFAYDVMAVPAGTIITNNATVISSAAPCAPDTTCDLQLGDNTSTATSKVPTSTGAETCTLLCHANFSVIADDFQGATHGAYVFFGAASGNGSCGAITATFDGIPITDPPTAASGAFYPLGTTVIHVSSDTGGGSCSFTITVVEGTPPTIACPPDKTATATSVGGTHTFTTAQIGSPTSNPAGLILTFERSDNIQATYDANGDVATPAVVYSLTDPFPSGTTGINWTVTDSDGLAASCTQRIVVHGPCTTDIEPPTITAPPAITVNTGPNSTTCGVALSPSDDELGTPVVHDDCSATVAITGIPPGNLFPVGTTTLTYTATDGGGRTASATQLVTVIDNTPPAIVAPANASYTCPSEVPAGSAAQAHGNNPNLVNGGPVVDNCGSAIVTVSDSSSGAGSAASPLVITRTFTATDASPLHNSASAVQTITVIDNTPPTISAPTDASYECASQVPAASASQATASDNCAPPTVTVSQTDNGGVGSASSPLVITRTYTATDAAGNHASSDQTITVIDSTPPTLSLTAPAAASADASCHAAVPTVAYTTNDNCGAGGVTVTQNPAAGSLVPLGTTSITVTAKDAAGNTTSKSVDLSVVDTTPPTLNATTPATVSADANCQAPVPTVAYTTSDNCSAVTVTQSPAAGTLVTLGANVITLTAKDVALNTTIKTVTFTVVDATPPTLNVTTPAGASADANCQAPVPTVAYTTSDNCSAVTVTQSPAAGTLVTLGANVITLTAKDVALNTTIKTVIFTVVDTTPPVITLNGQTPSMWPPNHKYQTFGVTNFVTGVNDNCNGPISVSSVVITKVTSDELENSGGDGNTLNDIVIAADCKSVQLRSERDGGGNGRVYTIFFKVADSYGNVGTATVKVVVQHNPGETAVDSGVHYTVISNCP